MSRFLTPAFVAVLAFGLSPAASAPTIGAASTSLGQVMETNPVGSLRWLPRNANERSALHPAMGGRLVVVYDGSLDDEGRPTDLLAKGPFGMKIFTTALTDTDGEVLPLRMAGHAESVTTLETLGFPGELSGAFMGVAGDVRDGDCDKAGTGEFSAAYTTTRTVQGSAYEPQECETINETISDEDGNVTGYVVTTHVPGFWLDISWPERHGALDSTPGRWLADTWYGAVYDTDGTGGGDWYTEVDDTGQSTSVYGIGDYFLTFSFSAVPGGMAAPECHDWIPQNVPGSFDEIEVEIPPIPGARWLDFKIYPKGDWDLFVNGPGGSGSAGNFVIEETVRISFQPGTYTVRGCNFVGETEIYGAVIVS